MRLWSIHPCYLDQQGLCGLWREGIMAKNALEQEEEHRYWNHSQLLRWKNTNILKRGESQGAIYFYLTYIYIEGRKRGYNFNRSNIEKDGQLWYIDYPTIPVTRAQVKFEFGHLADKLTDRGSHECHNKLMESIIPKLNPLFYMVNGKETIEV